MEMDVREKLVELLKTNACPSPFMCVPTCRYYGFGDCFPVRFADHLISHGVTVQEWISVKDRLPEDDSDVLAYLQIDQEGRIYPANYAKGVWFDCIFNTPATGTTTHWMPLPKLPKGE